MDDLIYLFIYSGANGRPVKHVCSLGLRCHSRLLFQRLGFVRCAYPFDLMYSSPFLVMDCLQDNFLKLLDRRFHTSHGAMAGHSEYDAEVRSFHGWQHAQQIFYHKNTKKNNLHYSYMQRCVCRFRKLLQKNGRKLFLLMLHNQTQSLDKQLMRNLLRQLAGGTSNTSELLVVFHKTGIDFDMKTESEGDLTFLLVVSKSRCIGGRLGDKKEERDLGQKIGSLYDFDIDTDGPTEVHKCTCQPPCNILNSD
jgi:hypothetical protein